MPNRRSEKETERLIRQFYKHLTMKKGISEETASAHAQRIEFFALHYLMDYEGKNLLDASGNDVENHLGDWYIRRVRLFSQCAPGTAYLFEETLNQAVMELADTEDEVVGYIMVLGEFIMGVFAERIMPALKLFGLLDFGYAKDRNEYFVRHGVGIELFSVTELGKKIFDVLAQ